MDAWLGDTGANFPTPDPRFDAIQPATRWESLKKRDKAILEQRHAGYVDTDFIP